MTSSQQKPMFTALLIASVAVVVYLFCIEPARQAFLFDGMDVPDAEPYHFEIVPRNSFEVAGRHGGWKPAKLLGVSENGAVTGTVLTVRSEEVKEPVMVRYLGRNRSMGTLFNEVSLPLGPFQDQKK